MTIQVLKLLFSQKSSLSQMFNRVVNTSHERVKIISKEKEQRSSFGYYLSRVLDQFNRNTMIMIYIHYFTRIQ